MTAHPNRGRRSSASTPKPEEVRDWRRARGFTGEQAAALVHTSRRAWLQWESGERRMHPAFWELARIKAELGGALAGPPEAPPVATPPPPEPDDPLVLYNGAD